MTPKEFRRMALSMPEAIEASHMGHPDFRVGKKIFATMGYPDAASAMVKLTPEQQSVLVAAEPEIFVPVPGGWGRTGSTNVRLKAADAKTLKSALVTAWRNIAPTSLVQGKDGGRSSRKGVAAKGAGDGLGRALARMRRAVKGSNLPDIEEVQSFGTPALKVRGKLLARVKDADTLVFRCPIEMKEILIESAPEIYFETDHYKGWPAILLRLSKAGDAELLTCLDRAWRLQAPKRLRDQHEAHGIRAPKLPDGSRPAKGRNRR
ncbi:MAG TPA: MmcQ/YjbR family DNA-binding protein [Xanthobacteraceae bacterium]